MRFFYGRQNFDSLSRAQENAILLTNGLGGFAGVTSACSANRCDQGILVAAVRSPNVRIGMVHRVRETLEIDGKAYVFSTQKFAGRTAPEEGRNSFDEIETVTLNMRELEYISSAGLRVVLKLHKKMTAQGGQLKLINVNDMIMEIFTMTGMDSFLEIDKA